MNNMIRIVKADTGRNNHLHTDDDTVLLNLDEMITITTEQFKAMPFGAPSKE